MGKLVQSGGGEEELWEPEMSQERQLWWLESEDTYIGASEREGEGLVNAQGP